MTDIHTSSSPRLRLGTRNSPLAMAQAQETRTRLCAAHGWDEASIELVPVVASGDKVLNRPLADIGGKALWTKELDLWLAEGHTDASVHSMKDVETIRPDWMVIPAILPRADVRDVLIGAQSLAALPQGARIGTSAPRRAAQLLHLRPDCSTVIFRGNVARRLARLEADEADATFLAAAGLERLDQMEVGAPLDPSHWLPAPSQGAIGVECRADDKATQALLAAIDHGPSRAQIMAERAVLLALGGTCQSPVAMLSQNAAGGKIALRCALFSPDGTERVEGEEVFSPGDADGPALLARRLLSAAGPAIRAHFTGTP